MSNTIKEQQPCHYRTYEKEKGFSDVEDCPKPATRTLNEIETSFHYVKNIINYYQGSQDADTKS